MVSLVNHLGAANLFCIVVHAAMTSSYLMAVEMLQLVAELAVIALMRTIVHSRTTCCSKVSILIC